MVVPLEVSPITTQDLWSSAQLSSDHRVLGHRSYQGPSPLIAQFGQAASSMKSPGCSKPLPLKNYGGQCTIGKI